MLHHAQSCSIMLHELIKLLLPEFEDKPVSLTSYIHFKQLRALNFNASCRFAYKRQLRNCVRQHFNPCHLVTKLVPLVCCVSYWIPTVGSLSRFSAPPLSLSHFPAFCDMLMTILCCCRVV